MFVQLTDLGHFLFYVIWPKDICVVNKDLIDFQNFEGLFKFSVTDPTQIWTF